MITVFLIIFNVAFCNAFDEGIKMDTAPLPDFRRRMEEIIDDTTSPPEITEDPSHKIVSFLIQNVKEIFKDTYDADDDDEETQADSVNIQRRKEHVIGNYDTVTDKAEAIASVIDEDSSTEKDVYYTITFNNLDTSSHRFKQSFNMKLIDEQNNERDLDIDSVEQHFKQKYEQAFETSTILFRPVFQIMTRFTTKPPTEIYFQNRRTELFNPETEFENISVIITKSDILSTLPYIHLHKSNINNYINPLPFLVSKTFEAVTARQPNTAKGLMFIANPETEARVARTTMLDGNPTKFASTFRPGHLTAKFDTVTRRSVNFNVKIDGDKKEPKRSCIRCNNAAVDWCSAPKNKLIPSTICKKEGDLCYSMHTPFGIVDRGCFNINHNMSTYVCGCNLCNYIAFTDLPVIFASKQEWIQDIFDLTHFKSLRKSTMKNLICLKCEGNGTRGDAIYNTNCKEGNLGVVKTVKCKDDEICAIKTIKNRGYIWRGCVSAPLYNYYITLCDTDLCNYDPVSSVYDSNE